MGRTMPSLMEEVFGTGAEGWGAVSAPPAKTGRGEQPTLSGETGKGGLPGFGEAEKNWFPGFGAAGENGSPGFGARPAARKSWS